jgi:hypothetical protein
MGQGFSIPDIRESCRHSVVLSKKQSAELVREGVPEEGIMWLPIGRE